MRPTFSLLFESHRHEAFIELIAMARMYGVPEFFVTFTANEMGWGDLHNACRSKHFSESPIEATRHYHRTPRLTPCRTHCAVTRVLASHVARCCHAAPLDECSFTRWPLLVLTTALI